MQLVLSVEIRLRAAQKGAQHQTAFGRGAHGMLIGTIITEGTTTDCSQAMWLISGITAQYLIADRGYDSDKIISGAREQGMQVVIPPKRNRKNPRAYDKALYKARHLVENAFLQLKRWRGITSRYAKNAASFSAAIHIRCLAICMEIS